ncbi:transposon Ty3-I Gag-Pol polyprotein [Nephila pilipes]|uniref:Transposon Ty3-I Gag-Pol polyprotein n=1 Tax=Nephila pilipes TaxID=299642 RepID=A0A8X6PZD4_NEPPI|nr:transposon Ty3-I Gag-Pol polyprotein [Nephila pilipes]
MSTSPFHALLSNYPKLFSNNLTPNLNKSIVTHCIKPRGPPVLAKAQRLNPEKLALRKEFGELMSQGIIRPSKSPYSSEIHFVKIKINKGS